ncbi:hypothetical protein [Nitratireductor sp. ZSWI3]|uniref:hypothetical protein n=1 Tax=Nitratireductor sp. ZSWI3 TaxID=2966359 RepID=UPI00215020F9|nr:hypothetical protein [Nitratireductor sp. ZSWI3]MCR4266439.1 hypothetical protein [Nitratireductor sp. ZSWI3]
MIVGFSWGGWVTGGTASEMAAKASRDAGEQLVASICVEAFVADRNAAGNLVSLKEAKTYERDNFVEDGGWIIVPGLEKQITGAADVCAQRLLALESLPERVVVPEASTTDTMPTEG